MVREIDLLEPDPERHDECAFHLDKYCDTYPTLQPMVHDMVDHESQT